jgi:cytidylate kinase
MYRVLTISREYGSGGGRIAERISSLTGWDLLHQAFIQKIAAAAQVDPELVRRFDERTDSWIHRVSRRALWHGAFEGVATVSELDYMDSETLALLARQLMEQACKKGNCIIVGRGAQCALQNCEDAFHVFIYAPWKKRLAEVRSRMPEGADVETEIRKVEQTRTDYIRLHYGCSRLDPHLYHMMISSELGDELIVRIILQAMGLDSVIH